MLRHARLLVLLSLLACDNSKSAKNADAQVADKDARAPDAPKADAGKPKPDAGKMLVDASDDEDGGACPSGAQGKLALNITIADGVAADVRIERDGGARVGDAIKATTELTLAAGLYRVSAHRVRGTSMLVGPAYQGTVAAPEVCVRAGKTASVRVEYAREPGSARLWLTQSNGSGAEVMAFDADQLQTLGDQTPSVELAPMLDNAGPIRVDGLGRLWVASNTGMLVAFNRARLGTTSTSAPDITLGGSSLCEPVVPCGPRAMAFDASGALWVATLTRIVKLAPEALATSGEPEAAVTLTSPDAKNPNALAFDKKGNLWVADDNGGVAEFAASRLNANIDGAAADVVIFTQQPGPVMIGLGNPSGLVFDGDGNLWIGYFAGNNLVRLSASELAASHLEPMPIVPSVYIEIGSEALVTDLALDEGGNLWLPGGAGALYRIAKDQLSADSPELSSLTSAEIGSVERIAFNTVPGMLFIAP